VRAIREQATIIVLRARCAPAHRQLLVRLPTAVRANGGKPGHVRGYSSVRGLLSWSSLLADALQVKGH